MNPDLAIVLALLITALAMFAIGRPRADAVGLIIIVALPFTQVLTINEALSGFSNPNIVLIAAMFVIGEGLTRAGIAHRLGDSLLRYGGANDTKIIAMIMLSVAGLGSVMSSTGIVAIFIPVALRIAARAGIQCRDILMPVAYAGLISGMMTLVATPANLVVNYELTRLDNQGFHLFSFTPIALFILLLAVPYWLVARRFLPKKAPDQSVGAHRPRMSDWVDQYKLSQREFRVGIRPDSPLVGLRIDEIQLPPGTDARIVAIERQGRLGRQLIHRQPSTVLYRGDVLLIDHSLPMDDINPLCEQFKLDILPLSGAYFMDYSQSVGMVEAIVPLESSLVAKSIADSDLSTRYGLSVIGLRRGRVAVDRKIAGEKLQVGDTLLLVGPWPAIRQLNAELHELVVLHLPVELDDVPPAAGRAPLALLATAITIGLMVSGAVPNVHAALIGCLLMGLFRCIDLDSAYRIIRWKTLILIVGMTPFALALKRTGGMDLATEGVIMLVGTGSAYVALAVLFMATVLLGLVMTATIGTILMIPIAMALAEALGLSPYPFALIVALAASSAFMSPINSVNALVVSLGNYSFGDFIRMGLPLTLLVMLASVFLVPVFFPF